MSEQVTVFKNVNSVAPTDIKSGFDIPILTTTSTQRAVIKDVVFKGIPHGARIDLDGYDVGTGKDLSVGGNLIMNPSSTLKLVVEDQPTGELGGGFYGMFFSNGGDSINYYEGSGYSSSLTHTNLDSSGNNSANDAVAILLDGEMFFFKQWNNNLYKYDASGNSVASVALPSTSYAMTTDGEYIYNSYSSGSGQTQYYKTDPKAMTTPATITGVSGGGYWAPQSNQGSYFLYHDGKIYSKSEGASDYMSIIDLASDSATTTNDSTRTVGSYSDGACVTTTEGGVSYIVEVGNSQWTYYNIATGITTRVGNGTSSSTEYGNGAAEIAPGIVLCFGEHSDRATIVNLNPLDSGGSPTWSSDTGSHNYSTHWGYGNSFAFAGYNDNKWKDYTYNVYVSGILIED